MMPVQAKIRILVAAAPTSVDPIIQALSGHYELHFLRSMAHAFSYDYANTGAIVCGMYFDESRMFDLLRFAKMDPAARDIPFLCVNTIEGALSKTLEQGITIACKALGAVDFVDLCHWNDKLGSDEACLKLHRVVDEMVKHRTS